jgi:rhomboid protease GluP
MLETVTSPPPADAAPPETFCSYLARQFVARKGLTLGTVPEAEKLAAASDIILTLYSGVPFTMLCLIDREAHPGKTFDLSRVALEAIAEDCLKYSATGMPVIIRVIEIGPTSAERWEQLKAITSPMLARKCRASALAVDPARGTVWSSSRRDGTDQRFIETILHAPRQSDAEMRPFAAVELPPKAVPRLTLALMAALALIYLAELGFPVEPPTAPLEPGIRTLIALGGLQYLRVVEQGEWWRMFTGPLLHANLMHIALNCVALLLAGAVLERAVGRLWLAALFVIGALGGACGSLLVNPHNMVTVGASGAIMGLFAAVLVISFHYTSGRDRVSLQRRAIQILIPSLLPLASAASATTKVDYGAHIGGAIAGAIAAFFLLMFWRTSDPHPRFRPVAIAVIAIGALGMLAGGVAAPMKFRFWTAVAHLIPPDRVPKKDSDINEASARWALEKYPDDPRSHFYEAIVLIRQNELTGAERELRATLSDQFVMKEVLTPAFNTYVQGMLALVLSDEQRPVEAKQAAAPACQATSAPLFAKLQAAGLCSNPP